MEYGLILKNKPVFLTQEALSKNVVSKSLTISLSIGLGMGLRNFFNKQLMLIVHRNSLRNSQNASKEEAKILHSSPTNN